MRITVIGCGRWGSLIAWYLDRTGHAVTLYGRPGSRHMQRFLATRRNDLLELPESIRLSTDLSCVRQAEIVVISIGSQGLQGLMDQLRPLALGDKIFVLCMKGLEQGTGRRLSQIAQENLDPSNAVAVWLGPGHVQEFYRGIPNCMVIDSSREDVKRLLVQSFSSDLIRFYYGEDLIGNEVGAAAKKRGGHRRRIFRRQGPVQPEGRPDEPGHPGGGPAHPGHGRQPAVGLWPVPPGGL